MKRLGVVIIEPPNFVAMCHEIRAREVGATIRISVTYDGLNRLATETTALGTVGYTYDSGGRRATMAIPD